MCAGVIWTSGEGGEGGKTTTEGETSDEEGTTLVALGEDYLKIHMDQYVGVETLDKRIVYPYCRFMVSYVYSQSEGGVEGDVDHAAEGGVEGGVDHADHGSAHEKDGKKKRKKEKVRQFKDCVGNTRTPIYAMLYFNPLFLMLVLYIFATYHAGKISPDEETVRARKEEYEKDERRKKKEEKQREKEKEEKREKEKEEKREKKKEERRKKAKARGGKIFQIVGKDGATDDDEVIWEKAEKPEIHEAEGPEMEDMEGLHDIAQEMEVEEIQLEEEIHLVTDQRPRKRNRR